MALINEQWRAAVANAWRIGKPVSRGTDPHHFIEKRAPGNFTGEQGMQVRSNGDIQVVVDAGTPSFNTANDGTIFGVGVGTIPMNVWTHVAYTWDGSILKVYRNGSLLVTDSGSGSMVKNSVSLKIGTRADLVFFYKGFIDELSIYNRALSAAEIQDIFNADSAGKCAANQPPIANADPDQSVHPGNLVTLDGSGSSDPDANNPLSYAWTITSKPAGSTANLTNPNSVNPSFTADLSGNYTITLVATPLCQPSCRSQCLILWGQESKKSWHTIHWNVESL